MLLAQGNLAEACDCIELQAHLSFAQGSSVCGISDFIILGFAGFLSEVMWAGNLAGPGM